MRLIELILQTIWTLVEVKNYMRIEGNYDDELISGLIDAAIMAAENFTKLTIITRRVELISAFARDKNQGLLTLLAEKITNKLTANACILQDYIVASMKACNMNFQRSSDLITTNLTIDYKALLKGSKIGKKSVVKGMKDIE